MHPPFIFTDHRVGPSAHRGRTHVRRGKPDRLDLSPAATGWPPVPLVSQDPAALPSGVVPLRAAFVQIVPPPRATIRDRLGRFLIRLGQRMILQGRPG